MGRTRAAPQRTGSGVGWTGFDDGAPQPRRTKGRRRGPVDSAERGGVHRSNISYRCFAQRRAGDGPRTCYTAGVSMTSISVAEKCAPPLLPLSFDATATFAALPLVQFSLPSK